MRKKVIDVGNLILIPWGILSLAIIVYFFSLCGILSDVFFYHIISKFSFIFSIVVFVIFVGTCAMPVVFMYSLCPTKRTVLRIINFIFIFLNIATIITLVAYCFRNSENFLDDSLTHVISFPNEKYTLHLKIKLSLDKDEEKMASKIRNYISARTKAPGITITSFYLPWFVMHVLMLRSIRKKSQEMTVETQTESQNPGQSYESPLTDE